MKYVIIFLLTYIHCGFFVSVKAEDSAPIPDFTNGGQVDGSHDWLLGPTGLRGWMYFRHQDLTASSRQIIITAVDKGSPADGALQINDVILGVFGKPFEDDARRSFGKAIAKAEEKTGVLPLTIWRDGGTSVIELKLQVLGAYSPNAPYHCPKSKAIFEQGCRLIEEKGFENADIPDHLNALALLATGDKKHHSTLGKYAKKVAESLRDESTWNWYIAYGNLFLSEYALATGKKTAFSELKQVTMRGVKNQCMNGMWGHAPALANGHSEGYGGMNVIGLPMTISFVLAREAGVKDPALDKAIEKSATFLRYYVDKGAIPYGDHPPWGKAHDDNGKSSCAAVLFDVLGDQDATAFHSKMATAAYDHREQGHCGNFWNMLWALPGSSRSGPHATGAYLKEQAWYYDLARNWKGAFVYQQIEAGDENNNYNNWDLTGGYLLSFGLYQKSLHILGKKPSVSPPLSPVEVASVIVAGRDHFPEGEKNGYYKRHDEELLEGLKSWSPVMRYYSAEAIGKRGGNFTPILLKMLAEKNRYTRYGAVEALGRLGKNATSALPQLRAILQDPDTWLQALAAETLARLGDKQSAVELMNVSQQSTSTDPRRMHQRATSRALFAPYPGNSEPHPLLADTLDGVDRKILLKTIHTFLQNDDSVVRAAVIPSLRKLNDHDLAPLLSTLINAVDKLAPTNEMWGDDIRQAGLDILSQRHIREGMLLCVSTIEWRWGMDLQSRMNYLLRYGKSAREMLPALKKIGRDLQKIEQGQNPSNNQKILIKAIADIEASTEEPKLITLKEFIARETIQDKSTSAIKPGTRGKPMKVYILAGQSNMQGHANISTFDSMADDRKTAPILKEMLAAGGKPKISKTVWISSIGCAGDDVTEQAGTLTAGFGASTEKIGPEFTFGIYMEKLGEPILIIKTSWGGKSLHTDFRPPSAGPYVWSDFELKKFKERGDDIEKNKSEKVDATGHYYRLMIDHIKKVLGDIKRVVPEYDEKQGYELSGFVWFQGFNDLVSDWTYEKGDQPGGYELYSNLLTHFIRDLRKDLSEPNLPFVIGVMGIGGVKEDKKHGTQMIFRQAQTAVASLPEFKGNVMAIRTAPFWDEDLQKLQERMEEYWPKVDAKVAEEKDDSTENKMKHMAKNFTTAEWKRLKGVSNGGYHYLGAAKIIAPIGKAFADAMQSLQK
jgi:Family of unknown function (DUF6288)/Carbohydrate esterase, sialic acid-specific acetylesterase/HEAT repeats